MFRLIAVGFRRNLTDGQALTYIEMLFDTSMPKKYGGEPMSDNDYPRTSRLAQAGEIISSPLFAQGHVLREGRLWVGEVFGPNKHGLYYDSERGQARFVVEDADWTEPNADGLWEVRARRIGPDGQVLDPSFAGASIAFYMRADYTNHYVDEVTVHGRMRRLVSFEPLD
jgi:hypothetical protein